MGYQLLAVTKKRVGIFGGIALALALLTGCSAEAIDTAPTSEPPAVATTAPAMDVDLLDEIQTGLETRVSTFRAVLLCMEQAGWVVEPSSADQLSPHGTFTVPGQTQEQEPLTTESYRVCSEQTGWGQVPTPSVGALSTLYGYELATASCLEGFGMAATEPPTEQTFVEQFATGIQWSAYGAVADQIAALGGDEGEAAWQEMNAACPQPIRYAELSG